MEKKEEDINEIKIQKQKSLELRFWSKVDKKGEDECWNWKASVDTYGYGKIATSSKYISAHKYSYIIHNSSVPIGFVVHHTCDNKKCVNPKHLKLITYSENTIDYLNKTFKMECATCGFSTFILSKFKQHHCN